ncbi:MAG: hypothetical protein D6698_09950 [Gammaproteobacteria bacterium]|nr:MAG: hypothetical protein D6698_09950 [Gammaproteobacteria bacterium]
MTVLNKLARDADSVVSTRATRALKAIEEKRKPDSSLRAFLNKQNPTREEKMAVIEIILRELL